MSIDTSTKRDLSPSFPDEAPQPYLVKNLPSPPELANAIESSCRYFGAKRERDIERIEREIKLQYYFGGLEVALMRTSEGWAVLAAGSTEEVASIVVALTPEERAKVQLLIPGLWDVVMI